MQQNRKNNPALSKVDYVPFLNGPNSQTPPNSTLTNPTPSPTPTTNTTTTPSPTPQQNEFIIESNSTVSALSFNGTSSEITLTVNGTTGTTGYVKATIAKSFMPSGENIKVYLDGNPINSTLTSNGDFWVITFTYHHSIHQVKIYQEQLNSSAPTNSEYLLYIAAGVVAALLGLLGLIVWLARSKD